MQDTSSYDNDIDTSDAEEFETYQALGQAYWSTHLPQVRTAYSFLDHLNMRAEQWTPGSPRKNSPKIPYRMGDSSDHPRKRLKIDMTPSSPTIVDGKGRDYFLPLGSSQTAVYRDSTRSSSPSLAGPSKETLPFSSMPSTLPLVYTGSQDPLDFLQHHESTEDASTVVIQDSHLASDTRWIPPGLSPRKTVSPLNDGAQSNFHAEQRIRMRSITPHSQTRPTIPSSPLSPLPSSVQGSPSPIGYVAIPQPPEQENNVLGRWSFRSRNVYQVHPYLYERMQYKRQMRGMPEAVVHFRSPNRRRRRSPDGDLNDEFIINSHNSPQSLEKSLNSFDRHSVRYRTSGRDETRLLHASSQRMDLVNNNSATHDDAMTSRRASHVSSAQPNEHSTGTRQNPISPPQRWYPRFLQEISSSDVSDDDRLPATVNAVEVAHERRIGKNFKRRSLVNRSDNEKTDSSDSSVSLTPRRLKPKPPPWTRHADTASVNLDSDVVPNLPDVDSNSMIDLNSYNESSPPNRSSEVEDLRSYDGSVGPSGDESKDSESSAYMNLKDRKNLRVLRRMMPESMIRKQQLQIKQKSTRRSVSTPPVEPASPAQILPGQSKNRIASDTNPRDKLEIVGDSESSDTTDSIIDISSSEHSISDVEELRTQMYPGVLDIPLLSATEDEETDAELEIVNDADIGAWVERRAVRRKADQNSLEARESDLIDRMLSRTRISGNKSRNRTKMVPRHGQEHRRLKRNGVNLHVGRKNRYHKKTRQLRLPDFFLRPHNRDKQARKARSNGSGQSSPLNDPKTIREITRAQNKVKRRKPHAPSLSVFPTRTLVTSGRRHKKGMTIDVEDASNSVMLDPFGPYSGANFQPSADRPRSLVENNGYRATHPTEFCVLPAGVSFGADTYVGRGWLEELVVILRDHHTITPKPYFADDIKLALEMDIDEFSRVLQAVFDRLLRDIASKPEYTKDKYDQWQDTLHAVCQFLTWMSAGTYDLVVPLRNSARSQARRLMECLDVRLESSISTRDVSFLLSFYWVAFEVSLRSCSSPQEIMDILPDLATTLTKHLLRHGYAHPVITIFPDPGVISNLTPQQRVSQIWINLFHVADCLGHRFDAEPIDSDRGHLIWRLVHKASEQERLSDLEASEQLWSAVFNICALSQFSILGTTIPTPRNLTSWELVSLALRHIRLSADPIMDERLSRRRLVKRDRYVHLLISRCFFLRKRWLWSLKDASGVFNHLVEVFKSRKFANLNGESSDFPSFMRHNDVSLLSEYRSSDTAFGLFLKLAAQSVEDVKQDMGGENASIKLRKLVSMLIPVGSVAFDKNTPPSAQELSMLYNRLSAIAVAILLDPSPSNVQNRLNQARRYITARDADFSIRRACLRGMMYFAMIMQRLFLPLTPILEWMSEVANVLLDEYQTLGTTPDSKNNSRNRVIITLQMLLGSLRRILESGQNLDGGSYPDPAFLEGPWITRVFSSTTDIANTSTTGLELQRLVQAFLDSRATVIPNPRRPQVHQPSEEDSQDLFGEVYFDFDDPELLAVLGEKSEPVEVKETHVKDKLTSEIIDKYVSPGIYRLVIKHVSDASEESVQEEACADIDKWVDCWVGCAQVVVLNGKRDWSFYLALGSQSWERIIDGSWRRRVGLRFMYMFLRLDPSSYPAYQDRFIDVLLESLVSLTVTMEHEYVSLFFSVDGLLHPLLRDVACERRADGDYFITKVAFEESRVDILTTIFRNLSDSLRREPDQPTLRNRNQTHLEHLFKMFSTMQDIYQSVEQPPHSPIDSRKKEYGAFCTHVMRQLKEFGTSLYDHDRLRRLVDLLMTFGDVHHGPSNVMT